MLKRPGKIGFLFVFSIIPLIGFSQVFHRMINQWDDKFHKNGLWITWQDEEKHIPSCKSRFKHGVEYRVTRYYHENGRTRIKYHFYGDSIVKVKYFDKNGHLTDKGRALRLTTETEIRFCWDGKWKHYDENHKLVKTSVFRKGEELDSNPSP
jgi:antitoxin component YwqK of YwqJK toxin-antitoxin module